VTGPKREQIQPRRAVPEGGMDCGHQAKQDSEEKKETEWEGSGANKAAENFGRPLPAPVTRAGGPRPPPLP
jgi:hypothetical protein